MCLSISSAVNYFLRYIFRETFVLSTSSHTSSNQDTSLASFVVAKFWFVAEIACLVGCSYNRGLDRANVNSHERLTGPLNLITSECVTPASPYSVIHRARARII